MKRKLSSFSLLLLPALLSAATLESVSGQLSYADYNPTFKELKGLYNTASKTLTITHFVGTGGEIYGATTEYGLVFNNVVDGGVCTADSSPADDDYFYSTNTSYMRGLTGNATVSGNTIVITYTTTPSNPTFYIVGEKGIAPGTTNVPSWKFTFTFDEDLANVVGDLTLNASLSDITTNSALVDYELSWEGGDAPDGLGEYTITVSGNNDFQDVTASSSNTSGTIELANLQYASPYIFNVTATVKAGDETYSSKVVTLQLEPVIESGMTLSIEAPETTSSNEVVVNYNLTNGNVSAGTPVAINIIGDNGFETITQEVTSATGTITLTGLKPARSYSFVAQSSVMVGEGNYLFSPVELFSVTTEGDNPLILETAEVEKEQTSATISGEVITSSILENTPVKVYYLPTPSEPEN